MPVCEVTFSSINTNRKTEIIISNALRSILLQSEGLKETTFSINVCQVIFSKNRIRQSLFMKTTNERNVLIKIYFLLDALDDVKRIALIKGITEIFTSNIPGINPMNIWCILLPIEHNCFGVAGNSITIEDIRQIVNN